MIKHTATKRSVAGAFALFGILALALALVATPAMARDIPGLYREVSADGKTLTYKFGEHERVIDLENPKADLFQTTADMDKVTTIVIDDSLKDHALPVISGAFSLGRSDKGLLTNYGYRHVTAINGLANVDMSSCLAATHVFQNCSSLTSLDLSTWDTSKVKDMKEMFAGCSSLKTLKLGEGFKFATHDTGLRDDVSWRSSADKKLYAAKDIPNNKAATYTAEVPEAPKVTMHRLYNPNSGEHFYTSEANERKTLIKEGWTYEGVSWNAPKESKTPVYRLYNKNAGDHHYTMSLNEKNTLVEKGWRYEGIGWYSDDAKSVPLYRQYNPNAVAGAHNYTPSKHENDTLATLGWRAEGIGWYGVK